MSYKFKSQLKTIFNQFFISIFSLLLVICFWGNLKTDNEYWDFFVFFATLEIMIFVSRLTYLCILKITIRDKDNLNLSVNNNTVTVNKLEKILFLTWKPAKLFRIPIEIKISCLLNNNIFYASDSFVLLPFIEQELIIPIDKISDINENKMQINLWYKIDIGFYSEWQLIPNINYCKK